MVLHYWKNWKGLSAVHIGFMNLSKSPCLLVFLVSLSGLLWTHLQSSLPLPACGRGASQEPWLCLLIFDFPVSSWRPQEPFLSNSQSLFQPSISFLNHFLVEFNIFRKFQRNDHLCNYHLIKKLGCCWLPRNPLHPLF